MEKLLYELKRLDNIARAKTALRQTAALLNNSDNKGFAPKMLETAYQGDPEGRRRLKKRETEVIAEALSVQRSSAQVIA